PLPRNLGAIESAERWRDMEKDAGVQNFDMHAFRAAFQMVLHRYYPEALLGNPSIGRQGKALRRQQKKGLMCAPEFAESDERHGEQEAESNLKTISMGNSYQTEPLECDSNKNFELCWGASALYRAGSSYFILGWGKGVDYTLIQAERKRMGDSWSPQQTFASYETLKSSLVYVSGVADEISNRTSETDFSTEGSQCDFTDRRGRLADKYILFEKFSFSSLCYLGLGPLEGMDLPGLWTECQSFAGLIGPYWSLRAALGPLLETLIQLDRLLFLQEQQTALQVHMLPIFDPVLSPRNLAIIAWK
ncbi:hypothetical protein KSS87_004562, partial [Heliosperma pusillum]